MIRYTSERQLSLEGFTLPFGGKLSPKNRWVQLSRRIPWDELATGYHKKMNADRGRPAKNGRLVIGAVIIKHKLNLSDEETVLQIQENPYLQYFVGLSRYQEKPAFAPSLFVEIRRRMGSEVFDAFETAILAEIEKSRKKKADANEKPTPPVTKSGSCPGAQQDIDNSPCCSTTEDASAGLGDSATDSGLSHKGKLIIDATVAAQAVRYPTDLGLLNESREITEKLIDELAKKSGAKKPRTYREQARKRYLSLAKNKKPGKRLLRQGIRQQLQYVRRNLSHLEHLLDMFDVFPLSPRKQKLYWVIQHVYSQQLAMHKNRENRCDDRIVSIHQPHVRPIVRGKAGCKVEFGAKISVSLVDGIAVVDHLGWDAFNEGHDLQSQVERYKTRYGSYPETVLADGVYGTRENRKYLKANGIRYGGKALGRPVKQTELNAEQIKLAKAQRKQDACERIPIEGKFGQGKNGYRLNYIRAKTAKTSEAWIKAIFLVMNLLVLLRSLCVQRTGVIKSSFSRYLADQFSWMRLELECFGWLIKGFVKPKMIF